MQGKRGVLTNCQLFAAVFHRSLLFLLNPTFGTGFSLRMEKAANWNIDVIGKQDEEVRSRKARAFLPAIPGRFSDAKFAGDLLQGHFPRLAPCEKGFRKKALWRVRIEAL